MEKRLGTLELSPQSVTSEVNDRCGDDGLGQVKASGGVHTAGEGRGLAAKKMGIERRLATCWHAVRSIHNAAHVPTIAPDARVKWLFLDS